jgi:DNA-3-methyladenine glycosylase I
VSLTPGPDGLLRCEWAAHDDLYRAYHDEEWGRPVVDDHRLFEKLVLEGFQAGLSWITILRKRDRFRTVFAGFDPAAVAEFGEREIDLLMADAGIVRHRGKIEAAVANAALVAEIQGEFGSLAAYVWSFAPPSRPAPSGFAEVPAQTDESRALAGDLKQRGWRFVGPTTVYAFMQAMGLVNDHLAGCTARDACEAERGRTLREAGG